MKITRVAPWIVDGPPEEQRPAVPGRVNAGAHLQQYVFVQVDTDEGLTGWGEVTSYPGGLPNRAVAAYLREAEPLLVGQDPMHVEALWHRLFRAFTYVGTRGATTATISAVDIALWDIRGKALGRPIYDLLGGPVRATVPLYVHFPQGRSVAEAVEGAMTQVRGGARAIKTDPFLTSFPERHVAYLDGSCPPDAEEYGVELIAGVREAIGPRVELLIDAHAMYNVPTAVRLANRLAPYGIGWFEEPVPPESLDALAQVRDQVPVRICVGERLHTRFEFIPIFQRRLADYVMPDVTWTGGITELKKISALCEAYYIPVSPHDAAGPVNVVAGAHVMMTVPNFYKLETSEWNLSKYNHLIDRPLDNSNGSLKLSSAPGLGIEINRDYLQAHEIALG